MIKALITRHQFILRDSPTVSEVAPDWPLAQIDEEWFERYSHRFDEYRFPKAQTESDTKSS